MRAPAPAPSSDRGGSVGNGSGASGAPDEFLSLAKTLLKIRVAVRMRPLNSKEVKKKEVDAMEMPDSQSLHVHEQK
jgi:hypothetical protein